MARLSADEKTVLKMFSYKRPAGSVTEASFVEAFLTPLGFTRDAYHNLHLAVGDKPDILFSSHVDTVHRTEGLQHLHYRDGILQLTKREKAGRSNCLGADDTAGIWLMVEMIKAGVPGYYVIHHAEERGCIGSSDLARTHAPWLKTFKAAIAFDRAGKTDVITHQMGRRCASEEFANSLSTMLGGLYEPDPTGSYTDTNEYAEIIPECTNISVGYRGQHTAYETQDVPFLIELRNKLIKLDWSSLVIHRDPQQFDEDNWSFDHSSKRYRYSFDGGYEKVKGVHTLEDMCREHPALVADILEGLGVTLLDLVDELSRHREGSLYHSERYDDDDFDAAAA